MLRFTVSLPVLTTSKTFEPFDEFESFDCTIFTSNLWLGCITWKLKVTWVIWGIYFSTCFESLNSMVHLKLRVSVTWSSYCHVIEYKYVKKYCIPFETNILDWFPLGTDKKDAIDKRMQIIVAKWARCKNVKIRLIMKKLPFLG